MHTMNLSRAVDRFDFFLRDPGVPIPDSEYLICQVHHVHPDGNCYGTTYNVAGSRTSIDVAMMEHCKTLGRPAQARPPAHVAAAVEASEQGATA